MRSDNRWSLVSAAIDILLICSGNICRSPMAEALMRRRLVDLGIEARVSSAGILYDGKPATPTGVEAMAARGLDTSGHTSRLLERDLLEVDLILGMAREHVREAVMMRNDAFGRAFTLKELVRRGEVVGAREPEATLDAWLDVVSEGREPRLLLGSSRDDDVADPIGQGLKVYEKTAHELDDLVRRLIDLIWPETG